MITVVVNFKLPDGTTREKAFANMNKAAVRFENMPGLIRKTFLFDAERGLGGGVYTWETREAAEAVYAEGGPWRQSLQDLYGVVPDLTWFETPVIVDNAAGEIKSAA